MANSAWSALRHRWSAARHEVPPDDEIKRVSWSELFYDLVFVFAVTRVTQYLIGGPSWERLLHAWVVFTPFWWAWVGSGILANLTDLDVLKERVRLFGIVLATFFMAVSIPLNRGDPVLFVVAFVVLRLLLLWWSVDRMGGVHLNPFAVSALATGPLFGAAVALPPRFRWEVWALLMVGELSTTWVLRNRLRAFRVHPAHLPERFGLVIMIALGESLVETGAAAPQRLLPSQGLALAAGFALVCGLWWTYFHFAHSAVEHQMRTEANQSRVIREILSYGHYLLTCAIIAVAVGLHATVAVPGARMRPGGLWLLCGGTALFLTLFALPRWGLSRELTAIRLPTAGLSLVLGAVGGRVPALVLLSVLAGIVAAAAGLETLVLAPRPQCACGCNGAAQIPKNAAVRQVSLAGERARPDDGIRPIGGDRGIR